MPESAFGGQRLIADSSAWTAINRAKKMGNVPREWGQAIRDDQIWMSPIVRLELLHSTRNLAEFDIWNEKLAAFREAQLTYTCCLAAISGLRELIEISPYYHRVGTRDALIAASAQDASGVEGVLHYNRKDFDRLAEVLDIASVELAPAGTFEN